MTSARDLGAIPAAMLARGAVARYYFVRLDFTSTLRYTDMPGGFTGNIDGTGSQLWKNERAMAVSEMAQGTAAHGERIDSVAFGNGDGMFCSLIAAGGVRDKLIWAWIAYFDTDGSLVDAFEMSPAYVDAIDGQITATIALKAFQTSHGRQIPVMRYTHGAFLTAPREGDQLTIGQVAAADRTRATNDLGQNNGQNFWIPPPPRPRTIAPLTAPTPVTGLSRSDGGLTPPPPATGISGR